MVNEHESARWRWFIAPIYDKSHICGAWAVTGLNAVMRLHWHTGCVSPSSFSAGPWQRIALTSSAHH